MKPQTLLIGLILFLGATVFAMRPSAPPSVAKRTTTNDDSDDDSSSSGYGYG